MLVPGEPNQGEVDIVLTDQPVHARFALRDSYGLDAVPRLMLPTGPVSREWCDRWLPIVSSALKGVAGQGEASQAASDKSQDGLEATIRFLGAAGH